MKAQLLELQTSLDIILKNKTFDWYSINFIYEMIHCHTMWTFNLILTPEKTKSTIWRVNYCAGKPLGLFQIWFSIQERAGDLNSAD